MFDTHIDYYRAVQCYIIQDPPLAHSLAQQWQYQDRINESVVCKLVQASQLRGFTGKLSIGSRIGQDESLRSEIPPPHWVSLILPESMIESSLGNKNGVDVELTVDEDDIPQEINVDTDLVVQLIERLRHPMTLSTFMYLFSVIHNALKFLCVNNLKMELSRYQECSLNGPELFKMLPTSNIS